MTSLQLEGGLTHDDGCSNALLLFLSQLHCITGHQGNRATHRAGIRMQHGDMEHGNVTALLPVEYPDDVQHKLNPEVLPAL